ncbi:MAG TPA: MotA/TolQ/ExbB proton channel family protein [Bacteroidia bacterium]|jgi:biopolymer transport protein ExbB|nr:MotA/TolQ/ExbB proton channel family protein [Bacteroidia bacterium]
MHHFLLQITNAANDTAHAVQNAGIVSPAATPDQPTQEITTPMQILTGGGPFMTFLMLLLLILLVISIYFAIERLIVVSKAGKMDRNFMNNIRDYLLNGKIDSARELCRAQSTPVSRVIEKGISRLGKPTKEISEAMEIAGRVEVTRVEKNTHFINLVARMAPMIGFIGTIMGVIVIFHDIAGSNGDVSIQKVSHGLYLKMFSSAAGLTVGVIAFIFYHFVNSMIDAVSKKIERCTLEFLDVINEPGK